MELDVQEMKIIEENQYGDQIKERILESEGLTIFVAYGLKDNVWIPFSLGIYDQNTETYSLAEIYKGPEVPDWEKEYVLRSNKKHEEALSRLREISELLSSS